MSKRPASEWVPVAEALAKTAEPRLRAEWLRENGYAGLANAIKTHPELFKHIPRG